jgi:hypothetical protein
MRSHERAHESGLPAPLIPREADMTGMNFMPVNVQAVMNLPQVTRSPSEACAAGLVLLLASWYQRPAGSLPTDDAELAYLAGFGRAVGEFRRVKEAALTGWVLCADGRLYHPLVAEAVLPAWQGRLEHWWRTECARIKKHNQRHGTALTCPSFNDWLSLGCPKGHRLPSAGDKVPCPQGEAGETGSKGERERQRQLLSRHQ